MSVKVKVEVKITKIELTADVPLDQELSNLARNALRAQLSQGIDALGVQHKDAKGKPWNFRESGDLLDTMQANPGELVITAEHAEHLNKIATMDGLAPAFLEQFEQAATETVERLLIVEDKE